ncbi:Na+/H+ antiporter NhaA [Mesorhizobium sp. RP14(2022)]|uniref:Na(+)/H(+) antiporter NhaA n=1 Tax=Mesorhizobium liriopis TaxID=2953882 RepID=A0ABT1CAR7_9HYPH|nr:Na+/H+ antiporter NhaA [Mesorhizobium liriopis]MCO6051912.1 Na+/H+ antiporter NhaA [Mesorhizobium liriopis]
MTLPHHRSFRFRRPVSVLRAFLDSSASGGLVLMGAAALALLVANSSWAPAYFGALSLYLGPLSLSHWINDALMALFFLMVGLEIKREMLDGQLASWNRRILPGVAALGGMAVPALIFLVFNGHDPATARGWAIPSATDIAFALGVMSLLGNRVPASLKLFLAALAIIDDLGAVLIIALFYSGTLDFAMLGGAALVLVLLFALNRAGVLRLWVYLILGAVLWFFVFRSGIHATVAGVLLALAVPLQPSPARPDDLAHSPLHRLEHGLQGWVTFLVIPIFGFANAGVSLAGLSLGVLGDHLTLGVALGLFLGKLIGVFGSAWAMIKLGWAEMPAGASTWQLTGTAMLCGIGFTMSLFIGLLAFADNPALQAEVKIGIIMGSLAAGLMGAAILRFAPRGDPVP